MGDARPIAPSSPRRGGGFEPASILPDIERRKVLLGGGALAFWAGQSTAQPGVADADRAGRAQAATPIPATAPAGAPSAVVAPVNDGPNFGRYRIEWAADAESVDVRHLLEAETALLGAPAGPGQAFVLTPALLARICANNSIVPANARKAPVVLFGIRGAALADSAQAGTGGWTSSASLVLREPDHQSPSCVLGVWYRGEPQSISLFTGSTVPNRQYVAAQFASRDQVCNLAPTGLHRFRVGQHDEMQANFLQARPYPSHRLPHRIFDAPDLTRLSFTNAVTDAAWPELAAPSAVTIVEDNLHPARLPADGALFSSAGCQVVMGAQAYPPGGGARQVATGDWRAFRVAAGLADPPDPREDGAAYDYLLISGREAHATAADLQAGGGGLRRLRLGSTDAGSRGGPKVGALQRALAQACQAPGPLKDRVAACVRPGDFAVSGRFGGGTMRLVLAWQAVNRGYADGIVDPAMLTALGVA
jgi:hypothetical protein